MADLDRPVRVLTPGERRRLDAYRRARSLSDLCELTGLEDEHDAYVAAKSEWSRLRERDPDAVPERDGLPGVSVRVGGRTYWVHGVTHADTAAERGFVRDHVAEFVDRGAAVFCEQGIRPMYFQDVDAVCEMDDYRWAMGGCVSDAAGAELPDDVDAFEGIGEDVESVRSRLRETVFSLLESRGDALGERVQETLGALATALLTTHGALGTADDFQSHALSRRASRDPSLLAELQHYYETTFLPQPVEREWIRRHDPRLERATHARNERMADYAVYHVDDVDEVHLIVGAAHQPGVRYYLQEHAANRRDVVGFQLC